MHTCKGCGTQVDSLDQLGPLPHGDSAHAYCDTCRQARTFSRGLHSPFAVGLALWREAAPRVAAATAPVALAAAGCVAVGAAAEARGHVGGTVFITLAVIGLLAFGILVTGTVVTHAYTGRLEGGSYGAALRRLPAWALTWCLVGIGVTLGYIALIVPGVILGLRLFWADELALAHDASPVRALEESWAITAGHARDLFAFQFLAGALGTVVLLALFGVLTLAVGVIDRLPGAGALYGFLFLEIIFLSYSVVHAIEVAKFYGMMAAYVERARAAAQPSGA